MIVDEYLLAGRALRLGMLDVEDAIRLAAVLGLDQRHRHIVHRCAGRGLTIGGATGGLPVKQQVGVEAVNGSPSYTYLRKAAAHAAPIAISKPGVICMA